MSLAGTSIRARLLPYFMLAPWLVLAAHATVTVTLVPQSASVVVRGQQAFRAQVSGTTNTSVVWYVDGIQGGSSSVGFISASGVYTAPSASGTHSIKAVSSASTTSSATSSAVVYSKATVDFGSRSTSHAIAPGVIGAQLGFLQNTVGFSLLQSAKYKQIRTDVGLPTIFANGPNSPVWTSLDSTINLLKGYGLKPFLVMAYTPSFLTPNPNPCSAGVQPYHAYPTDVNAWAQLAAKVVLHVDQTFPHGTVDHYEIWNEPDLPSAMCLTDNSDSAHMNAYLALYAAAAPQMKTQAHNDGATIYVGGPAIVRTGVASTWFPALLSNTGTYPYVDFVSYHHYMGYTPLLAAGVTWEGSSTVPSLKLLMQDARTGYAAFYRNAEALVKAGLQLNASKTPVIISEYNDDSAFQNDCCRNSPTYSPLFNTLFMADLLNSVYAGAQNTPGMAVYFSASTPSGYFCLFGQIDSAMDCVVNNSAFQGYPQYYAYKLIAGSSYLGMYAGGHLAASASPVNTQDGLIAAGFYTATKDSIILINPTATPISGLSVLAKNPGTVSYNATQFLLNSANPKITSSALTFVPVTAGVQAQVSIPAYSVVGIALQVQ